MSTPYPDYERLLAQARAEVPKFVSPQDLDTYRRLVSARGTDWCSAVLGRPFGGLRQISVVECRLLLVADREDIAPPLPAAILAARERRAAREQELAQLRQQLEAADWDRWRRALTACRVDVEVRANMRGRRTGTGLAAGPLRHVVPMADAESGGTSRPRLHPAGRAVCETATRARPRMLAEPEEAPATCVSCLKLTPALRPR